MRNSIIQRAKKGLAGLVAATLLASVLPMTSFAADDVPTAPSYAILGSKVEAKLMSVQASPYPAGEARVVTKDGTEGWELTTDEWPGFIRVNVDDAYIFGGSNRVEVDVKYFDESAEDGVMGKFTIAYNSVDAIWKEAETVQLTGTNKWLVHKFILEDAKFANESEGNDFRVAYWAQSMGKSPKPITIGSIAVEKLKNSVTAPSYAILGSKVEKKLMSVEAFPYNDVAKVATKAGREGWELTPDEWPGFIRVNVDDSYIFGGNNRVEVDVEYFDESSDDGVPGKFTIAYNSVEATFKEAETVQLTGTNKWLVHKFVLEDAKFANESEGNDFRVAYWAQSMGKSPKPVVIGSISVEKLKRVSMTGTSDKVGNIFDVNEDPTINLEFVNEYDQPDTLAVDYQVFDAAYGRLLKTGSVSVEAAPNSVKTIEKLKLDIKDKGVYTLLIDAKDADGSTNIHQDIPFSIIQKLDPSNTLPNSVFGAQTHLAWGGIYNAEKIAPLFKDIGAKYARDEYYWSSVETTKGVYTFPEGYDHYIDTEIQNGIVPLIELNFGNNFYDGGKAPHTPEAVAAYANYCRAVVAHLKGKVKYFEIWNEWNGSFGNGLGVSEYYTLLKEAYKAIKEANPDAVVLGGAVAASDYGWLESLLKAGGGDYMDVISFHPYTNAGPEGAKFAETMVRVKESFKKLGFDKPMWATEIGWSSGNHTEVEQAAFATQIKTLVLSIPGVLDKVLWYDSLNDGMDKSDYESNFGLLSQRGPYSAKPAYVALSANENLLGDASFVKEYKLDDNIRILKFHSTARGKDILALWTKNKPQTIGLNLGTDTFKTVDLFGNETDTTAAQNILSTTLTGTPVYYVGSFSDQLSLATPSFKAQSDEINVAAGDTVTVNISRSAAAAAMSGKYSVSMPAGWTLAEDGSFKEGQSVDTLTFTVPADYANDSDTIAIIANDSSGSKVGDVKINVKKVIPIVVSVTANPVNPADPSKKWELLVEIQNNYSKLALSAGTLSVTEPVGWADTQAVPYDAINPSESRVIKLPIPDGAIKEGTHVKLNVQPDSGDAIVIDQIINDLSVATYAQASVTVDGNITEEEWDNAQTKTIDQASQVEGIADWGGPSDLSAKFRTKWDEEYLYLAIQATDNVHNQPYTDGSTWQADGIQLAIDPGRIYGSGSRGYNEIGFALNNDGTVQKYRWIAVPGQFSGAFDDMKVAIKRDEDEKQTNYEVAIPWAEIMPEGMTAKSGTDIGFSFLINDSDGGARRGWIQYMGGIGGDKNPKYLADLVLKGVPAVTGINLTSDAADASIAAGESFRLTAALDPADAAIKSVVFTSGDDKVASVSDVVYDAATGTTSAKITGLKAGDGVITATAGDGGAKAEYRFVVKEATDPGTGGDEAPGKVSAVNVASSDGKLTLTWDDPTDEDLAYVRIAGESADGKPIAVRQVNAGVRRAELDGLTNGVNYRLKLTAVDAVGHESEAVSVEGTPTAPYIPSNPPASPTPDPSKPVVDSRGLTVEAKSDASGLASAAFSAADLEGAIKALGGSELRIAVKPDTGASGVRVALPADALLTASSAGTLSSIVIDNGLAPVTLDAKWLATQAKAGETVTLTVAKADTSKLPQTIQDQLAGRPVYDFKLEVGGRRVEQFGKSGVVRVAVPYSLSAGQQAGQVVVYSIDDEGRLTPVVNSRYDSATGTVRFAPAHFSLYAVSYAKTLFNDLQHYAWAIPAVEALAARGAVRGDGNGTFRPNGIVTRAEFVTMLANTFGLASEAGSDAPTFTDVAAGQWYSDTVASAAKLGIVTGRADGSFGLDAPITRQEMAAMLYRAASQLKLDLNASSAAQAAAFTDADAIAPYARDAAAAMQRAGILQGTGAGAFAPAASTTRAQAATAIYRLFERQ